MGVKWVRGVKVVKGLKGVKGVKHEGNLNFLRIHARFILTHLDERTSGWPWLTAVNREFSG